MKKINILFFLVFCMFTYVTAATGISMDFESGTLNGWSTNPGSAGTVTTESVHAGTYSIKIITPSTSVNAWDCQLLSPDITVSTGQKYKISFWAKAVGGGGKLRISTKANQLTNDAKTANQQYLSDLVISDTWTRYTYISTWQGEFVAAGSILNLNFDMGTIADKTYYIDDIKVESYTIDKADVMKFGFDSGDLDGWKFSRADSSSITSEDINSGLYALKVKTANVNKNGWDFSITSPVLPVDSGHKCRISFWAKTVGGTGTVSITAGKAKQLIADNATADDRLYLPELTTSTDWAQYVYENIWGSALKTGNDSLVLNLWMGKVGNRTFYIDDLVYEDLTNLAKNPVVNPVFDFESGTTGIWGISTGNGSAAITKSDKHAGSFAIKAVRNTTVTNTDGIHGNNWDLELKSPAIQVIPEHKYKISFWARVDGGDGRINLITPAAGFLKDASGNDLQWGVGGADITNTWTKYTIGESSSLIASANVLNFNLELGYVVGKTYYIDDIQVEEVVDTTTGINGPSQHESIVYLSNNLLLTANNNLMSEVHIYDTKGSLRMSMKNVSRVDMSSLCSGVYIAKTVISNKKYITKIIK